MKHVPPPTGERLSDVALPAAQTSSDALTTLARLRKEAAAEIERLLAFLDETDGDCDLEPSLGSSNDATWTVANQDITWGRHYDAGDREVDAGDNIEIDADEEPIRVPVGGIDQRLRFDE